MLNLNQNTICEFKAYLQSRECSRATIEKYVRDVHALLNFCGNQIEDKSALLCFKEHLLRSGYAISSINSMLSSVNGFLTYSGYGEWKLRYIKVQRTVFAHRDQELTQKEYLRMVETANKTGNVRLAMILQTICSTGIRVSELCSVTVESLQCRRARIDSKGKMRLILLPKQLCIMLKHYCKARGITSGIVFRTKNGLPLDRSNIWKMMKRLAQKARVQLNKVYPHNLRHLFACTYYEKYQDIVRLADILGHSSVNTTRIYTKRNACEQLRQMGTLGLIVDLHTT